MDEHQSNRLFGIEAIYPQSRRAIKYQEGVLRPMEPKQLLMASVLGFALMVVGFVGYVFSPGAAFEAVFVVGVVLLILGYAFLYLMNRNLSTEVKEQEAEEDSDGFYYILDEDYSAPAGDATVTDLTRMKDE